jgi:hypothetical protein
MNNSGKVQFDQKEVDYLMHKTGLNDAQEAVALFAKIVNDFQLDPFKMHEYIKRLMEMDDVHSK